MVDLLPVLLALLISPARTIALILLLHTPRHAVTAGGYVIGMISAMMAHGMVTLELAQRFPPDADLDTAWTTGINRLSNTSRTNQP